LAFRLDFAISTHKAVTRVNTGHENAASRRAHGAAGIMLGELHPLFCEAIDVRGFEKALSVTRKVSVTSVIQKDVNDVRSGLLFLRISRTEFSGAHCECDGEEFVHSQNFPEIQGRVNRRFG
jgi:hypothetical protein